MAEPFAAAVLQDEQAATQLPDPKIRPTNYKAAWEDQPTELRGDADMHNADVAKRNSFGEMNWLTDVPDTFQRSMRSGNNVGAMLIQQMDRAYSSGPIDPSWRASGGAEWAKLNKIPETDTWRYTSTRNKEEAEALLSDQKTWANDAKVLSERHGITQTIAWGLPMVMDIDLPATMFGGALLSGTAKAAINASKFGAIVGGAVGGGATGLALGELQYESDPNSDWTVIPLMGLAGIGFGAVGGAFTKTSKAANLARGEAVNELGEAMEHGVPRSKEDLRKETFNGEDNWFSEAAERDIIEHEAMAEAAAKDIKAGTAAPAEAPRAPGAINIDDLEQQGMPDDEVWAAGRTSGDAGSIGARNLNPTGPGVASIRSTKLSNIVQGAQARVRSLGIATDWLDGWRNVPQYAEGVTRQVERFHNFVNRTPLGSDFGKMMNSGSAVFQAAAYDMMENAAGIVRNGRSGARLMEHYQKQLGSAFIPFDDAFTAYATTNGAGMWRRMTDSSLRNQFNREVAAELMSRYHDGAQVATGPVRDAAEAIRKTFDMEVDITKGRPGEHSVKGTDQLVKKDGYMPQKWSGLNMRKMVQSGVRKRSDIVDAIAESYVSTYRHMDPKDAKIYADAVVERAERMDGGVSSNMIGLLQADGRDELRNILVRNGMNLNDAEQFIDRLTGKLEERGKPGWAKGRLDVDMRFRASNGIEMMDLFDTDFATFVPSRIRRSSGASALARKGFRSKQDWDDMVDAGLQEQAARGNSLKTGTTLRDRASDFVNEDVHVDKEFMNGMYSYFGGGPVAGGIGPGYARMKKLTNLALLNQLGLTQLAELGPTMAAVGLESFFRHAGEALTGALRDVNSPLVQELKHMNILVPEEKLFRADLTHEFEKSSTQNEWARGLDRFLNKGQHIQGYTSGFNQMRNFQQRVAVTSAAEKLAKHFRDGGLISPERMRDMGLDGPDIAALKDYVDRGVVQFDSNGNLLKLNMDQWAPEHADLFAMTLNQRTNVLVQKAMAGESSMLFHKDGLAQLFFHLKSFPMLALEKQAMRNTRMVDTESAMTFMYGLGTAAAAYTVRQAVNGRTDRLDYGSIAKGAFGYSNMTGWIPMWVDPVAAMLGMNSLQMGGGRGEVISPLASLETMNRIAKVPGALLSAGDLSISNADINALSSAPLIGNIYGMGLMWTLMRNDNTAKKEEQRKEQRAKVAPVQVDTPIQDVLKDALAASQG